MRTVHRRHSSKACNVSKQATTLPNLRKSITSRSAQFLFLNRFIADDELLAKMLTLSNKMLIGKNVDSE